MEGEIKALEEFERIYLGEPNISLFYRVRWTETHCPRLVDVPWDTDCGAHHRRLLPRVSEQTVDGDLLVEGEDGGISGLAWCHSAYVSRVLSQCL